MSESPVGVRQRGPKKKVGNGAEYSSVPGGSDDELLAMSIKAPRHVQSTGGRGYKIALAVITALAFVTRFHRLGHPNEVVFDEVHFGKVRGVNCILTFLGASTNRISSLPPT